MAAVQSVWRPFRPRMLTHATSLPFDVIRAAMFSLSAASAAGFAPGWSYTNSVTQPARSYVYYGTGNTRQWVKTVCTYTGNSLTKAAMYYSEDNEATYVPMYDEGGINYVITLVYDGDDNLESSSWGNTP